MARLAPLSEEPINDEDEQYGIKNKNNSNNSKNKGLNSSWRSNWKWIKTHFSFAFNKKYSNHKILLSVLGCPLFPIPLHQNKLPLNEVSSSAQYIIQHFRAATGCRKFEGTVKNVFTTGKVEMMVVDELGSAASGGGGVNGATEKGCFVMWQMVPDKWQIELVLSGQKVIAGSNGAVAWRHTPWLGTHAAKGGVRPLRRALQGLDPLAVSSVFSGAQYMGEKQISDMDCFVLKLTAEQKDLAERSDSTAEMIKHSIFGYFSQRSGLLVHLEDSYLTRIQSPGSNPVYWETTMSTKIEDYRNVEDGVMISHSGSSVVIITRFGDNIKAGSAITRLEESWTIDDVAFNVQGLSMDCFIPPQELEKDDYADGDLDWRSTLHR